MLFSSLRTLERNITNSETSFMKVVRVMILPNDASIKICIMIAFRSFRAKDDSFSVLTLLRRLSHGSLRTVFEERNKQRESSLLTFGQRI